MRLFSITLSALHIANSTASGVKWDDEFFEAADAMYEKHEREVIGAKGLEQYVEDRWGDDLESERKDGRLTALHYGAKTLTDAEFEECAKCMETISLTVPVKLYPRLYICFEEPLCKDTTLRKNSAKYSKRTRRVGLR